MFQSLIEFNLEELNVCLDKFVYLESGAHETLEGFVMSELPLEDIKQGLNSPQPALFLREAINNHLITNPLKTGYMQAPEVVEGKEELQIRTQFWQRINKQLLKTHPIKTPDEWMTYRMGISELLKKGHYYFVADNPDSATLKRAWHSDQHYPQRMFTGFAYAFNSRRELWAYINKDTVKINPALLISSVESLIETFSVAQQEQAMQTFLTLTDTYKEQEIKHTTLTLERRRFERFKYLQEQYLKLVKLGFTKYISNTSLFVLVTGFLNSATTVRPFEEFLELLPPETVQTLQRLKKGYKAKHNPHKLWIMHTRASYTDETESDTDQYILIMQILPPKSTLNVNEYWSNDLPHNQYYLILSTWSHAKVKQTNVVDRNLIFLSTYGVK